MQPCFKSFVKNTRNEIRFLTCTLHMEGAEGCPYFLPWDVIDDLHEFARSVTYITLLDGTERRIPGDQLETQMLSICSIMEPFHLFLTINTDESSDVITVLRPNFLSKCNSLLSLDTSGLPMITSIGESFLCCCKNLKSVDTSGLVGVTTIGDYGFYDCPSLTSVDTSGLTGLTSIGDYFLTSCPSLTTLDTSHLQNLTCIGF
eukprot:PhF_6_TR25606/c0_g1_i4/m.35934